MTSAALESCREKISRLSAELDDHDAVLIGAGAGLSTSAGYTYSGTRFTRYFADFEKKYGFHDMYSGGFQHYPSAEEMWAYWSRHIYVNRYAPAPSPLYEILLDLVRDKDVFVLTTNVDHCFQRAGFDKKRLFYTQGDYGLWQCQTPCCQKTWDNRIAVLAMLRSQGYSISPGGELLPPADRDPSMAVPAELVPACPVCGRPMAMNLRSDGRFVEDEGWHRNARRYMEFLERHEGKKILLLELGVGWNTPGIIKYPFWKIAFQNSRALYACINQGEARAPDGIRERSLLIDADIAECLSALKELRTGSRQHPSS